VHHGDTEHTEEEREGKKGRKKKLHHGDTESTEKKGEGRA